MKREEGKMQNTHSCDKKPFGFLIFKKKGQWKTKSVQIVFGATIPKIFSLRGEIKDGKCPFCGEKLS
jgi:hypothetical protein